MKITLFDRNEAMIPAWDAEFSDCPDVATFVRELVVLPRHDAIVTPGNSFGIMTGGFDLAMRKRFGYGLQDAVQNVILQCAEPLPVGGAIALIADDAAPHGMVIFAPTIFTPRPIRMIDVCYATTGALFAALENGAESVALPALGGGSGQLSPEAVARGMRAGYDAFRRLTDA